jgi:hypothetical protein
MAEVLKKEKREHEREAEAVIERHICNGFGGC